MPVVQTLTKWLKKYKTLRNCTMRVFRCFHSLLYGFCHLLFRMNEKKAVFCSFNGKSYSCNPRAISEYLHESDSTFKIVWLFNNVKEKENLVPGYIKCIKNNSIKAIFHLATAKYWIDNFSKSIYTHKRKGQIYIQTWHGDKAIKKILYDCRRNNSKENCIIEEDKCDLMLSGSDLFDRMIKSAFRYNGEVLQCGSPRNDLFFSYKSDDIMGIKNDIGISKDVKVLMFAPTFRNDTVNKEQSIGNIDLIEALNVLEKQTNQKWVCLARAHSAVKGLSGIGQSGDKIIDVTKYEDMRDLLLITDLLITDYSSSAGDFAILKRPIILYQPDRKEYMEDDREFYFDIDKSPFALALSQEELIRKLQNFDEREAIKQGEKILEFYGSKDSGKASEMVVEYMLSKLV